MMFCNRLRDLLGFMSMVLEICVKIVLFWFYIDCWFCREVIILIIFVRNGWDFCSLFVVILLGMIMNGN